MIKSHEPLLQLTDVETFIGPYHILHGVTFELYRGETLVLLGRNGVGKTTTLRTLMGLWPCSKGEILLDGQPLHGRSTEQIASRGIGYVPENMGIFASLTVEENMLVAAPGLNRSGLSESPRLARIFEAFPALEKFWRTAAGNLSGGQKQMLAVARAWIEPKPLLVIDEPTKGLAPSIVDAMAALFEESHRDGVTILLVEQNLSFASRLAERVIIMESGRIVHTGVMRELMADQVLQDDLLGLAL